MAGTRKGGINNYTVQEAMNINLGQCPSIFVKDTGVDVEPPAGHVFVAIVPNYQSVKFTTLESPEPDRYINTAQACTFGGTISNTDVITDGNVFSDPIYGRWNKINLAYLGSTSSVTIYIGK